MRVQDPRLGLRLDVKLKPWHIWDLELEFELRDSRPGAWAPNLGLNDLRPSIIRMSVKGPEFWILCPSSPLRRLPTSPDCISEGPGHTQIPERVWSIKLLTAHMSSPAPCHTWHHKLSDYSTIFSQELPIPDLACIKITPRSCDQRIQDHSQEVPECSPETWCTHIGRVL